MKVTEGIINGVQERLGEGYDVSKKVKECPNGVNIDSVVIQYTEKIAPVINCGEWSEMSDDEAIDKIVEIFESIKNEPMPDVRLENLSKSEFLSNIMPQVVNTENNKKYLSDKPHTDICDLSVFYRYVVKLDEDGIQSIPITDDLMGQMGVIVDELHKAAIEFVEKNVKIYSMYEALLGFANGDEDLVEPFEAE